MVNLKRTITFTTEDAAFQFTITKIVNLILLNFVKFYRINSASTLKSMPIYVIH